MVLGSTLSMQKWSSEKKWSKKEIDGSSLLPDTDGGDGGRGQEVDGEEGFDGGRRKVCCGSKVRYLSALTSLEIEPKVDMANQLIRILKGHWRAQKTAWARKEFRSPENGRGGREPEDRWRRRAKVRRSYANMRQNLERENRTHFRALYGG